MSNLKLIKNYLSEIEFSNLSYEITTKIIFSSSSKKVEENLKELILDGLDINGRNKNIGCLTALEESIISNNLQGVEILLRLGARKSLICSKL